MLNNVIRKMSTNEEDKNEFRFITGKKCLRRKLKNKTVPPALTKDSDDQQEEINKENYLSRLNGIKAELKESKYFIKALSLIKKSLNSEEHSEIQELVCFGIGSFTSSLTALHQLAFILEIQNALQIKTAKFYDPVFNADEKDILTSLECDIFPNNCEGKYVINCTTLLYFPHCPKQLTNNFLWMNWDKNTLSNAILLCNSFEQIINNTPNKFLLKDAAYILKIKEFTKEYPLENLYKFADIFNDTSLHIFPSSDLSAITTPELWIRGEEPTYDETEMILSEMKNELNIVK